MSSQQAFLEAFSRYFELDRQGRYAEAEPFARDALQYALEVFGSHHLTTAKLMNNLGEVLREQGRYTEAEPCYLDAVPILNDLNEPEAFANTLNNLALCYRGQGRREEAESTFQTALKIQRDVIGTNHWKFGNTLHNLGLVYQDMDRYDEAVSAFLEALPVFENAGKSYRHMTGLTLYQLGFSLSPLGRYDEAERYYRAALPILHATLGPKHQKVADAWSGRGENHAMAARYDEAVLADRRALAIYEAASGPNDPGVENTSRRLGLHLLTLGRDKDEAARLLLRSFRLSQKRTVFSGVDLQNILTTVHALMMLVDESADRKSLEVLQKMDDDILRRIEQEKYSDDFVIGTVLQVSANLAHSRGQDDEAIARFERALQHFEKAFGGDSRAVEGTLESLASVLRAKGELQRAAEAGERALAIATAVHGPEHFDCGRAHSELAATYLALSRLDLSLQHSSKAVGIFKAGLLKFDRREVASEFRDQRFDSVLINHIETFQSAVGAGLESRQVLVSSAFEAAQLAVNGPVARSVWRLSVRLAAGDSEMSRLVRERQDALQHLRAAGDNLMDAESRPPGPGEGIARQMLLGALETWNGRVEELDAELEKRFPAHADFVAPRFVTLQEAQALLCPGEALLTYVIGAPRSFLVAVRRERAELFPLKTDERSLEAYVKGLRDDLTVSNWPIPSFSAELAYEVYKLALAPAEAFLKGVTHLNIVPHGPLLAVPFGVLATREPEPVTNPAGYRSVAWLTNQFSVSVLPSPSSLRVFRTAGSRSRADLPFVGFGDPLVGSPTMPDVDASDRFRGLNVSSDDVRRLPRLPETGTEVRAVAEALGADSSSIYLGERATKANLRSIDLARYKVVLFATHGLLAGEIEGLGEPALALTPAESEDEFEDGLLTASEVAELRLNADWVVLSACNTAASTRLGQEGLSSLVNAFFHAGARTLLVSHWAVSSEVTVKFITQIFLELARDPGLARAEAVRRAMQAVRDEAEDFGHPGFWAPFELMGDGMATQ